jgi:hypothetical protein
LVSRRERSALQAELTEIESDLATELLELYRRGTSYEEFWELVEKLRDFGELRKNFSA